MAAIPEAAATGSQRRPDLGEQASEGGRIPRQFRPVEARRIGQQGTGTEGEQLHMAGGVPAALETARHKTWMPAPATSVRRSSSRPSPVRLDTSSGG
jgi:hypothetical protein